MEHCERSLRTKDLLSTRAEHSYRAIDRDRGGGFGAEEKILACLFAVSRFKNTKNIAKIKNLNDNIKL